MAFRDVEGFGGQAQPLQKAGQGLSKPQVDLPVLGPIHSGLQFPIQRLLLTAKLGRSVAQLVDGDQLLLMGIDQTVDALAD